MKQGKELIEQQLRSLQTAAGMTSHIPTPPTPHNARAVIPSPVVSESSYQSSQHSMHQQYARASQGVSSDHTDAINALFTFLEAATR